jgi:hypothetical protein
MTRHLRPAVTPDWLERCTCETTGHCVACEPQRQALTLGPASVSTEAHPPHLAFPAPAGSVGAVAGPTPVPPPTSLASLLLADTHGWGDLFDEMEPDCG